MRPYRDEALVVRQHKLGEADLIITLLTRQRGLVRAVGKGVRRTRSKFGGRLDLFSHIDVVLYPGRGLDTVTHAETLHAFGGPITADYAGYTAACAVLESAARLAGEERAPAPGVYSLAVAALESIAAHRRPPEQVLDAFLLRGMRAAGWEPALASCAVCGGEGPLEAFHIASGGAVCAQCRPAGSVALKPGMLELLDAYLRGRWSVVAQLDPALRPQATGLIAALAQWNVERRLRTLKLVERGGA